MALEPVTRRDLTRELVVNAATHPANVAVPAAVAVAGFLLAQLWLVPLALVVYVAMIVATFFDTREAKRVGERTYARARARRRGELEPTRFASEIAEKLALAQAEEERVVRAAADAPAAFSGITGEVGRLMHELGRLAERAQRIHTYLALQDEDGIRRRLDELGRTEEDDPSVVRANEQATEALTDQLVAVAELRRQLARFHAQMEHITGTLGAIHAAIVGATVTEDGFAQTDVAARVEDLRTEVHATATAMRDAYDEIDAR